MNPPQAVAMKAETLDPKIEKECRRPAFCRTPEGAVEMGVVLVCTLEGEAGSILEGGPILGVSQ